MPSQDHSQPGHIAILATEPDEQDTLSQRQHLRQLRTQITTGLNALENQWAGMTAAERTQLLRHIHILQLKAWRFILRRVAPRL